MARKTIYSLQVPCFFIFLFWYLISISIKLVRYVIRDNQQLIMYSFRGKKMSSLNLETDVYYEVLLLIEGIYSKQDFVVLSNSPFVPYQASNVRGLAKLCKSIDKNGKQIVMPYNQYVTNYFDSSTWHKIH